MARIHWVPLSVLMHLNLRTLSFTQTMHVPWVISIPSKRDSHDLMECAVRGKGNTRDVLTACLQFPLILSLKQEPWDDCSWSERTTSLCWGAFLQATRKMDSEVIPSLCERDHLDSLTGWCLLWPNRRKAYVVGNSSCPIPNQCQVVHQNSMMIMTSENKFLKIQVSPNGHFSLWHPSFDFHIYGLCFWFSRSLPKDLAGLLHTFIKWPPSRHKPGNSCVAVKNSNRVPKSG